MRARFNDIYFTDTARIACDRLYVTVRCLFVCLSVPSIDHGSSVRRACCCVPRCQATSIDCYSRRWRSSTVVSSKCEQCHVVSWRMKLNRLVKANDLLARVPSRLTKDHRPTDLRPDRHHQLSRCWRCHYMPLRSIYSSMDYDTIFAEANAASRPSYDRTAKARLNTRHNNLFSVHFVSRWHGETSTFRCPIDGRVHCFSGLSLLTVIYI